MRILNPPLPHSVVVNPAYSALVALCGDVLMKPKELAERWRLTEAHLGNQRRERRGVGFLKLGGAVRYRVADVIAYELSNFEGCVSPERLALAVLALPDFTPTQRDAIAKHSVAALFNNGSTT
jgi:hypothetical protein